MRAGIFHCPSVLSHLSLLACVWLLSLQYLAQLQHPDFQALAVYLYWLKTGNCQQVIATHFNFKSHQAVSRYCEQVREALTTYFVPEHLGAHAKTRDQWLQHRTLISNELFDAHDGKLLLAAEGTFCFCEKSAKNSFQKQAFKRFLSYNILSSRLKAPEIKRWKNS